MAGAPRAALEAARAAAGATSVRRRAARLAATTAVLTIAFATVAASDAARSGDAVTSVPVAFRVVNSNTSGVPCSSDGRLYTVRGHLTGPRGFARAPRAVTLYLSGYDGGEWNWRLTDVPRYDFAEQLAHHGLVSLTVDELGYGTSDHPDGTATCFGAQADMAHQIVTKLRTGDYTLGAGHGLAFRSVALAGHDVGGLIAEIEAYSYRDIDALIEASWADQGQTPYILQRASVAAADWCTFDSQPQSDQPGSPSGYHYFTESASEFRDKLFFDPDPAVIAAALRLRSRNPCGMIRSVTQGVAVDQQRAREIAVPVLVVFGDRDTLVWSRPGEEQQQSDYGSADKTAAFIPDAGHFVMLDRTAPQLQALVASWLSKRGFGGAAPFRPSPARPHVGIPRQALTVDRRRRVRIQVDCNGPADTRCVGTLLIVRTAGRRTLCTRTFSIWAGRSARLALLLPRSDYKLVRRRRHMRMLVVATLRSGTERARRLLVLRSRSAPPPDAAWIG